MEPEAIRSVVEDTTRCAAAWVASLSPQQQRTAVWPFGSVERGNWHYAPRQRHGVPLRDLDDAQREAALRLLASGLSARGAVKASSIMALEAVLAELEDGRRPDRDPWNYAFTVFGDPATFPWGWRVEGHHLIVNVTVAGPSAASVTPTFWGANPARIPRGPRAGERVMGEEYHLGLELARSLAPSQRELAVLAERSLGNIVTERGRATALGAPAGLPVADLTARQRAVLRELVGEHVGKVPHPLGAPTSESLRRDRLDGLRFAWAGGMAEGEPFYYRVHGPRLLLELDCTPDDANHIHSVWRDPAHDWGRDVLGEHYRRHHDED